MNGTAELTIEQIDTLLLLPTADNPRKIDTASTKFRELVASVRARGVLVPLIARPHPTESGYFDLRAGHRRLAAAIEADRPTVPVIVREMDDAEAMEVTVLENMQREDLNAIEEARGVVTLMKARGNVKAVAEKIGKSVQWVLRRSRLASLATVWADLADGGTFDGGTLTTEGGKGQEITIRCLELVALYPQDVQTDLFNQITEDRLWHLLAPGKGDSFKSWLDSTQMLLSAAPFDVNDDTLKPGACTGCAKRSSCNPGLFDDEMDPKKLEAEDRCLDEACFWAKQTQALDAQFAKLRRKHKNLVRYAPQYSTEVPADTLRRWNAEIVEQGTPGAVPALIVNGPDVGKLQFVKPHDHEQPEDRAKGPTLAQRRIQLLSARRLWAGERVVALLQDSELPLVHDAGTLLAMVAAFGCTSAAEVIEFEDKSTVEMAEEFESTNKKTLAKHIWEGLKPHITDILDLGHVGTVTDDWWQSVKLFAPRIGADAEALFVQACTAIPEPDSWQDLAEDDEAEEAREIEPDGDEESTDEA